jgi:hypothetical protein
MTLKPSANHQRLNNNNHIQNNNHLKKLVQPPDIDFSLPITTTYLKHMRSLGYTDEDALKIDVEVSPSVIKVLLILYKYSACACLSSFNIWSWSCCYRVLNEKLPCKSLEYAIKYKNGQ